MLLQAMTLFISTRARKALVLVRISIAFLFVHQKLRLSPIFSYGGLSQSFTFVYMPYKQGKKIKI
jgi:hypothetical protein